MSSSSNTTGDVNPLIRLGTGWQGGELVVGGGERSRASFGLPGQIVAPKFKSRHNEITFPNTAQKKVSSRTTSISLSLCCAPLKVPATKP